MTDVELFGIDEGYPYTEQLFIFAIQNPMKVFPGYKSVYSYARYGYAEFSTCMVKDKEGNAVVKSCFNHVMGNAIYRMRIDEVYENTMSSCVCLCTTLEGTYQGIPVSLVFSDCLPSLLPGDEITFQGIGLVQEMHLFDTSDKAEEYLGFADHGETFMGKKLHLKNGSFMADPTQNPETTIFTTVREFKEVPGVPSADRKDQIPFCKATVDSMIGKLELAIPLSLFKDQPDQLEKLRQGGHPFLVGSFILSGDVCTKEYKDGAIFDEEHFLRLFRSCQETGDFTRLEDHIADTCSYTGWKGRTLESKDAILETLAKIHTPNSKTKVTNNTSTWRPSMSSSKRKRNTKWGNDAWPSRKTM